jgi:hypothetical protein
MWGRREGVVVWSVVVAAVALAGCGGSSGHGGSAAQATIPAYGVTPALTVPRSDGKACRTDASTLAEDARGFLAHFGKSAAYPADLNYVIIRGDLARLQAGRCDPGLLGGALRRSLTAKQRAELVADLPSSMARAVRRSLTQDDD